MYRRPHAVRDNQSGRVRVAVGNVNEFTCWIEENGIGVFRDRDARHRLKSDWIRKRLRDNNSLAAP